MSKSKYIAKGEPEAPFSGGKVPWEPMVFYLWLLRPAPQQTPTPEPPHHLAVCPVTTGCLNLSSAPAFNSGHWNTSFVLIYLVIFKELKLHVFTQNHGTFIFNSLTSESLRPWDIPQEWRIVLAFRSEQEALAEKTIFHASTRLQKRQARDRSHSKNRSYSSSRAF